MNNLDSIKSIIAINTSAGWAARQRNKDGSELYVVCDPSSGQRYTMHQAQRVADELRSHIARGGETYAEPLPDGVRVVRS